MMQVYSDDYYNCEQYIMEGQSSCTVAESNGKYLEIV